MVWHNGHISCRSSHRLLVHWTSFHLNLAFTIKVSYPAVVHQSSFNNKKLITLQLSPYTYTADQGQRG